jgi:hypothetical protein
MFDILLKMEKFTLTILRKTIQGGISNDIYPVKFLYDSRLTYHIPTLAVMKWKGYVSAGDDSKFTDLRSAEDETKFAEGKTINKARGICLKPSVDTGGGRSFCQENLDKCLERNSHYFLYETVGHTDHTVTFEIYWVPIEIIRHWYATNGNGKGLISYTKLKKCILETACAQTLETHD